MKTLAIGGKEYKVEFSFGAAEYKDCVSKAFKMLSGSYMVRHTSPDENQDKAEVMGAMIDGSADMVADLPHVVPTMLYAGLLEHNPVKDEAEAKSLFRQFIRENPDDEKASYFGMWDFLRSCMEDDGFFRLTGLDRMIRQMNQTDQVTEEKSTLKTIPQDHKKKQTSTK